MTHWLAWSAMFSAFIALAALGLERAAAHVGVARRFVWIAAMIVAVVVPIAIATRVAPLADSHPVLESPAVVSSATNAPTIPIEGEAMAIEQSSSSWNPRALVADADGWIAPAWLGASILWFVLLIRAVMRLRRRRHSWQQVETDAGPVLVSNDDGPAVVGFVQPRIVIPRWALAAEPETRELLLLHEREHLRANDSRVLFSAAVLLALVPWNAALWWMSRRLRLAIEIDCDARVIRASGARHSYGHMLITIGERHAAPALPASAFLSEPGTHLEARIDAMTTPSARRPLLAALPFAFASAFVLGAAAWTPLPTPFRVAPQAPVIAAPIAQPPAMIPAAVSTPILHTPTLDKPKLVAPSTVVAPADTATPTVADPIPLRGNPAPRYPDSLRALGVEGHVFMKFSTNALGIPDTSTIQLLEATDELFTESVRRTLPRWRYDSQGPVRFAVYFRGPDSGLDTPTPIIDGVSIMPVIVTATIAFVRRDTVQQDTPVRRQFDALVAALNSQTATLLQDFNKRYARKDAVRDPTGEKGSALLESLRASGGFDILTIRRSQSTSLEFVARERGGDKATHVGYFAIASAENPRVESFRMLLVRPGRSVDDAALIEHLQNMRP